HALKNDPVIVSQAKNVDIARNGIAIPSGAVPSFFFNHQLACPEISMSWQKLVLLNYTLMCLADAPLGLVQPFACSDASSEQTHGLRCGLTK
ncbi:hypothetical protein, partial [Salmonella enterica]